MKKSLLILMFIAGIAKADMPAYTNLQYFVWADGATATNALAYMNENCTALPLEAKNAGTGETVSALTVSNWCGEVIIRLDGKYCFPRPSDTLVNCLGLNAECCNTFFDTYSPDLEIFDPTWFVAEIEE